MKTIAEYSDLTVFDKLPKLSTIANFMEDINNAYGAKDCTVDALGVKKYHELYQDASKIVNLLSHIDAKKHVVVYCQNNYNFVRSALAIMASGKVAVLLPAQLDEKMLYGCLMKYQASSIVFENATKENTAFAKNMLPNVEFYNIDEVDFNSLENAPFNFEINENDPACIVLTGGTTGRSKGAILSHKALLTGTKNGVYAVPCVFDETYFSIIPLTHVFGLIRNLLTCLYTGSKVEFCIDMKGMFKQLPAAKPSVLILVPALAELFLNLIKQFGMGIVGGNLKMIICGGASVPPYLTLEYNKLGVKMFPGYGLTESANLVSGNPKQVEKPSSVGLIYPGLEVKVVDQELWLKGDNMMTSYFNEPTENEIAYTDGWFKTGDLVEFDEEGFLYIIGRIKDIIVLPNGENVSPAYVEAKINDIEVVQDSLVTLQKNELGASILTVEILPRKAEIVKLGITNLEEYLNQEVEKVNNTLLPHERVQKIVIRTEDFKRSPSMKIIRPRGE